MNQSFYVGALGAGSCSSKISVIANNLANINNNGFKPKTAVFSNLIRYNLMIRRMQRQNFTAGRV